MTGTTKIVFLDEHQTFLDLMEFAIAAEPDLAVVGTARTAADGRRVVDRTAPDVVVLESVLPDGDGVATAAALVAEHPRIRVVVLTAAEDTDLIGRAAAAGASGFLAKSGALKQVIDTIRGARPGFMIVDPVFMAKLRSGGKPSGQKPADRTIPARPALTDREFDVLRLLDQGKDSRTIARELSISLHTSRGYVKSLLAKLQCHSQLEAVVTARRLGLLAAPERMSAAG
jgi:DNA-binding NarL/FixJ family response regulator